MIVVLELGIVEVSLKASQHKRVEVCNDRDNCLNYSISTKWILKKDLRPNTFFTILTEKGQMMALLKIANTTIEYDRPMNLRALYVVANSTNDFA